MKKSLLIATLAFAIAIPAMAKYDGPGYYRVQNYKTERYLYVLDNRADVDYGATSVDMNGVELWRGEDRKLSDASTVLYITQAGSGYDIQAQGTGIYAMSSIYLNLRYDTKTDTYLAYGTRSGATKYLGDPSTSKLKEQSYLKDSATGDYRKWYIKPIDANSADNFFGLAPTVAAAGSNYATLYADFPFSAANPALKIYYVSAVDTDNAIAVISEIPSGVVPRSTPVLVKCVSTNPADNKLNIGDGALASVKGNQLAGVYFNNDGTGGHRNQTAYDAKTMRVLGLTKDGKLGFITSSDKYLARNQSYLRVPAGCPAELTVMTPEEYEAATGGVDDITVDASNAPVQYYNLQGVAIDADALTPGIYVKRQGNKTSKILVK